MTTMRDEADDGTRGAVLPEFVIAIVPLLMMLFGWLQLAWLYTANVLVKHSADVCVRAAAVIDERPFNPGNNGEVKEIQIAAERAAEVQSKGKMFESVRCDYVNEASETEPHGKVTATVTAEYRCGVPMGKYIVCGPSGRRTLTKTSTFPFQGARYKGEE